MVNLINLLFVHDICLSHKLNLAFFPIEKKLPLIAEEYLVDNRHSIVIELVDGRKDVLKSHIDKFKVQFMSACYCNLKLIHMYKLNKPLLLHVHRS